MKIEIEYPLETPTGDETLYTVRAAVHGEHRRATFHEPAESPELEIEAILAPGGYVVHEREYQAHGFTADELRKVEEALWESANEPPDPPCRCRGERCVC